MYKYVKINVHNLSCRYMAVKTQEKKTSLREEQLERKVTSLEEELQKTKMQLDQEFLAQEAKRAKVTIKLYCCFIICFFHCFNFIYIY